MAKKKSKVLASEAEFTTGSWSGQPQFKCKQCPFDTFSRNQMLTHLVEQHGSEAALDELFPASAEPQAVRLQEPEKPTGDELPAGIYEIEIEEVDDAQNDPE